MRAGRSLLVAVVAAVAAGCATTANDPRDPFEGLNRGIYSFNQGFDDILARPVATVWRDVLHEEIRSRVRNFFSNLADPMIGVNNLLQGKLEQGVLDFARFAFNSTIGLLGLHDVASDMGIDKHNEDFGQTFGWYGVGSGPYIVLPILGSSSVRDGVGWVLDIYTDPVTYVEDNALRNSLVVTRAVQTRADLLDASNLLEQAALDKYVFQREAYFQRRRNLIYDGDPPRENGGSSSRGPAPRAAGRDPVSAAEPAKGNVFEPRTPRNYEAVIAARNGQSR